MIWFLTLSVFASDVIDLTPDNFDTIIDGSKPALVEFFAPWCGHCKSLAPTYEELGGVYAKYKDSVIIAKVDADAHKSLGNRFSISGFPTLKFFPKGAKKPEDYSGGRDLDAFIKYINGKTGLSAVVKKAPTAVTVLDSASFDEKIKGKNALVEFYAPWCGHCKSLAPIYEKVAKAFTTESNCLVANVDATESKDLAERYKVGGYPTIKFFNADGSIDNYDMGRTESDFVEYLNRKCGTQRAVGGALLPSAGKIKALDDLAKEFLTSKDAKLIEKVKKNKEPYAKYYAKVMEKVLKKADYVATESARLKSIIEKGTTTQKKLDDFYIRLNILDSFSEEEEAAEKAEL